MRTATAYPPPRLGKDRPPEMPCAQPNDPAGFIYPSYRAAGTEAHGDERSLETSQQDIAHVSTTVGGSVSTLSFEDTTSKHRRSHRRRGEGIRGRVKGFSKASRRNLLRHLASIDRNAFRTSRAGWCS